MELTGRLALGLNTALSAPHLLAIAAGSLLGLWIRRSGGRLSVSAAIALLMPLVPALDAASVLMMFVAVQGGAAFGGARCFRDAAAAALSALVGSLAIALLVPLLTELGFHFGAAENFSLMLLCLVLACVLAAGSLLASLAMTVLGLLLTQIGHDPVFGTPRFLVELPQVARGISVVPLALGLFAGAEMLAGLDGPVVTAPVEASAPSVSGPWRWLRAVLRGTGIGLAMGLLPGSAPKLARACSIASEWRLEDDGAGGDGPLPMTGAAAAGQSATLVGIVPMLALGVPINGAFALLAAALSLKGLQVGPLVMTSRPELFWGLIAAMALSALGLLLIAAPVTVWRLRAGPLRAPVVLAPLVLLAAVLGVSLTSAAPVLDISVMTLATLAGYLLRKLDCQVEPLLLAFVLGPLMEDSLRRALQRSEGDWAVFIDKPLSLGLLIVSALVGLAATPPLLRRWRDRVFA